MGSPLISLSVQSLVDSGRMSSGSFWLAREWPYDDPQETNDNNSPSPGILNAVKLSLLLTREFAGSGSHCHNGDCDPSSLQSLGLENFVIELQNPPKDGREEKNVVNSHLKLSSAAQFDAVASALPDDRWILRYVEVVKSFYARNVVVSNDNVAAANDNASVNRTLGKLLHAVFSRKEGPPAMNDEDRSGDARGEGRRRPSQAAKSRRNAAMTGNSLFQRLIVESGLPTSICRLLSDLLDGNGDGTTTSSSSLSVDDVVRDLEQMISLPHTFLHDSDATFHATKIHFGRKYHGRSRELAKLLEITTVPRNKKESRLDVVFVSGIAGCGKSHLVSAVGDFVPCFGFMVLSAKFKRGMEYKSRDIVSILMNDMISNIARMGEEGGDSTPDDVDYSRRTARAISTALDADSLSALADFIPSIQSLIPGVAKKENNSCTHWQLVFLLSKLLFSVLSQNRKIFIALDDLQWADPTTLGLLKEVLLSISRFSEERQRLVFVGLYRDDEVSKDLELLTRSLSNVSSGGRVNVTNVRLSTLSLEDITEMIMSELRLPRRLVAELADVVHKRTLGHALFVVQFLNSLTSDSTIVYSPMLRRFHWDQSRVCNLTTADSVASLIVSNLTLLPEGELLCLRIVSCFGIQVRSDLLEILEVFGLSPPGGFKPPIRNLIDQGIIKTVLGMIVFAHDLIQEQVYEGIPEKERRQLHCDIGIFLSSRTSLNSSCEHKPIDTAIDELYLSDASVATEESHSDASSSSLISIATSQINNAGQEFFSDRGQNVRFAGWNLRAGKDAAACSSFRAALYYYKNGISFLGDDIWLEDTYEICLKLCEGAGFSASALGENGQIALYVDLITSNAKFEDSLVAECLLIGSLTASGEMQKAVGRGLAVLRQLEFGIPATSSPEVVMQVMKQTEQEASAYNFSQISDSQARVGSKTRNVLKLVDAISAACYTIASPFLPLVACATIRYSLQNGVCEESASAFVIFAYFQIFIKQSFELGRHWGNIAKDMLEKTNSQGMVTARARFLLFPFVDFWFIPLQESIKHMQDIESMSLKFGDTERAYLAMCWRFRFTFFRGEQLSILSNEIEKNLQPMARFGVTGIVLDKVLIDSLTGDRSSNPYAVFGRKICNKESLLADAKSKMHFQTIESVHLLNFFVSFWMGDYDEAVKASDLAMSFPSAKMPKVQMIYHTLYRGVIAFQLHRKGVGEKWLKEGNRLRDQVKTWVKNSKPIFENKLHLLEAERFASMCDMDQATKSYELSIKVARDNGYVHEQGLAYECMGTYLMSVVEIEEAEVCFMNAVKYYTQWGATAKANKLRKDTNLDSSIQIIQSSTVKHDRDG